MMKSKWAAHIVSSTLVIGLLSLLILWFNGRQSSRQLKEHMDNAWINSTVVDVSDPEERTFLSEALNIFDPNQEEAHRLLISKLQREAERNVLNEVNQPYGKRVFNFRAFKELLGPFFQFTLIYIITFFISWYGVITLGSLKFIWQKQGHLSFFMDGLAYIRKNYRPLRSVAGLYKNYKQGLLWLTIAVGKALGYITLFSPAYVLAYSFRTRFDTDIAPMMIALGVISNGALITYTYKFYVFLKGESKKGYVETAVVKNMYHSYAFNKRNGIVVKNLLRWNKQFPNHVFGAIYKNARLQFLSTLKEQASFLISGLIIIEMALNIQGHLSYKLLQQILYKNYGIATAIVLGLFILVKLTDILVDVYIDMNEKKYSNR